jgi:multicomponent K+:H+ antiporter subunit A
MAISFAALLIVLIALPFAGSCLAALFPANVRNAEAYLAGGVALTALVLVIAIGDGLNSIKNVVSSLPRAPN